MVPAESSAEFILRRSTGRPSAGVVLEMHPGRHAVCLETTAKHGRCEAVGTDGRSERAVDILVRQK